MIWIKLSESNAYAFTLKVMCLEPEKELINWLLMKPVYSLWLIGLAHFREQTRYCEYPTSPL